MPAFGGQYITIQNEVTNGRFALSFVFFVSFVVNLMAGYILEKHRK